MGWRKVLILTALIFTLTCALTTLDAYRESQRVISLEANDLYTREHISTVDTLTGIRKKLEKEDTPFVVYRSLDESGAIRAAAGQFTTIPYPVNHGRRLTSQDEGVALAGNAYPRTKIAGRSYITVKKKRYEVVGDLGRHPQSLLASTAIIADSKLFPATPGRLSIDGPSLHRHLDAFRGQPVYQHEGATTRRTNIDFISPVLSLLTSLLVATGAILAAIFWHAWSLKPSRIATIIGHPPLRQNVMSTARFSGIVLAAFIGTLLTATTLFHVDSTYESLRGNILLVPGLAILTNVILLSFDTRRRAA